MGRLSKEYIRTIVPEGMTPGEVLMKEGAEIAKTFEAGETKYAKKRGCRYLSEYMDRYAEEGRANMYGVNIGMATVDETVEACKELGVWGETIGLELMGFILPSMQLAVPKEKRDSELDTTAFMVETEEEYARFNFEEMYCPFGNFVTVVPNAIETTVGVLKAGLPAFGTSCQLAWDYPGCDDHIEVVENVVRALGIIREKNIPGAGPGSYVDDGLAGCCMDTVGYIAAYLLDRYIYTDLCGIPCEPGFGGLVSNVKIRAALMKAFRDLAAERGGRLSFTHGSTTQQWDHDIASNYGLSSQEMLMTFLAEDHYKTGCMLLAVPATEAITIPTTQEIKDIIAATARVKEFVPLWRDLINWDEIDAMAEDLKREGRKMFQNILTTLEDAGVDTKDVTQMLKFVKDIDGSLFEQAFHPSIWETGTYKAWYPNDMGEVTVAAINEAMQRLEEKGYGAGTLSGKRILVGSTDTHSYGVSFVSSVLTNLGADVVGAGVDNTSQSILDAATEEGIKYVCVSTHSGNAIGIANGLEELMEKNGLPYFVSMGGILTSILPGHSRPSNVAEMISEKERMIGTNDILETVEMILNN